MGAGVKEKERKTKKKRGKEISYFQVLCEAITCETRQV